MNKKDYESHVVEQMIRLYCRHREGNRELCASCQELLSYCNARLDRCPRMAEKTTCRQCPVHCYRPDMRQRIAEVMRWAGPRMLIYHPVEAIKHLWMERTHSPAPSL